MQFPLPRALQAHPFRGWHYRRLADLIISLGDIQSAMLPDVKLFSFLVTLFAGALFAQQPQLAPVPGVTATIQTAPNGWRQIIITNSGKKTITALVVTSERVVQFPNPPRNPANAPSNAPGNAPGATHGVPIRSSFRYDAAVSTALKLIESGTTNISRQPTEGGPPVITAVVYADGSSAGDQTELDNVASLRKAVAENLRAVIADTQAAISAQTADDFAAIMSTKVNRITADPEAILMPINSTYGDLARINQGNSGMAFQRVQKVVLPKALDNFKKRLAKLQQLVPGL
jgi:hypothetical protein